MQEISIKDGQILARFFTETYDSCADAFLDGNMGRAFADSNSAPTYGVIQIGDFCFFGGNGDGPLKQNVANILKSLLKRPEMILVPLSESWYRTLSENIGFERTIRYALAKPSPNRFNQKKLATYISRVAYDPQYISENTSRRYLIKKIDEELFRSLPKKEWAKDFVSNYRDYTHFARTGLGFVIIEGATGSIISGASSFSSSNDYMELQLATDPDYEGKGYATAVAARFILECLNMNKIPCWDAANLTSMHIAQKLGYEFIEEYVAFMRIQ